MRKESASIGGEGHLLIVGINYWPEQTGISPYTTGLAEHLVKRGWQVSVVTGMPHYPQWRISAPYRRRYTMHESVNGVQVSRKWHYVPSKPSAVRRGFYELTFLAHGLTAVRHPKPTAILGISPSVSGGVLAKVLSRRYRVPYGLVIQDLAGQAASQSGIKGGSRVARATSALEGWSARSATGIGVITEGFRPHLEAMGVEPSRIRRIRNWTHTGRAHKAQAEARAELGLPTGAWICLHAGNMGLKQGLENVVNAARQALQYEHPPVFVLMGDGNQREHLEAYAAGLDNVRFLPAQSEEAFPDALAAADVLLVNQLPTVVDMCLPGKLTSYLAVARPVVAAVADGSETARELLHAGAGIVVPAGAPDQLLTALLALRDDPVRANELGRCGQVFAFEHLTADAALGDLERLVCEIAGRPFGVQSNGTSNLGHNAVPISMGGKEHILA